MRKCELRVNGIYQCQSTGSSKDNAMKPKIFRLSVRVVLRKVNARKGKIARTRALVQRIQEQNGCGEPLREKIILFSCIL